MSLYSWLGLIAGCLILALLYYVRRAHEGKANLGDQRADNRAKISPYRKRPYLMTPAERHCLTVLQQGLPPGFVILPQVNLDKVLTVRRGTHEIQTHFNRINRKSFDFVIFDGNYYYPKLAIELDDASHQWFGRKERDTFVEQSAQGAQLALLRISHDDMQASGRLKALLQEKLQPGRPEPALENPVK